MKKRFLTILVLTGGVLLAGCGSREAGQMDQTQITVSSVSYAGEDQMQATAPKTTADSNKAKANTETTEQTQAYSVIDETSAKEIAFRYAGVEEADASYVTVKKEYDDGKEIYEIEFCVQNSNYDCDVDVSTGEVRKMECKSQSDTHHEHEEEHDHAAVQVMAYDEAAEIVLNRVQGAGKEHLKMKLEEEDGCWRYEGEIHYNGREYEFELNAADGQLLEWKEEVD
ncbi:MAG: PepSY domain-containing protein [Fusicatenibacter sp.]|nr:PepSY domain-containing protein [Fusicatenibacter sp.]